MGGEMVPRNELSNQLIAGVGGVGAGIALLLLQGLITGPVGWVAIGVLGIVGLVKLFSKDGKPKALIPLAAAGITALAAFLFPGLIWLAGVGLLGVGGFFIYKFFKNMKDRV